MSKMKFLSTDGDYTSLGKAWISYKAYIDSIRDRLPPQVYEFAIGSWHYVFTNPRSLHDSWVEEIFLKETVVGPDRHHRVLSISLRLLGAYHNGYTYLTYEQVTGYDMEMKQPSRGSNHGHGDWLIDEVSLADTGEIIHDILFSSGTTWTIKCHNIIYSTDIPESLSEES